MNQINIEFPFVIKSMDGVGVHEEKLYDEKIDIYRFQVNQKVRVISFDYVNETDEAPFLVLCTGEVEYFSLWELHKMMGAKQFKAFMEYMAVLGLPDEAFQM